MSDLSGQKNGTHTQYQELKDLTITQATVQTKHFMCSYLSFALFVDIQNNNVDKHNNNYRFHTQKKNKT